MRSPRVYCAVSLVVLLVPLVVWSQQTGAISLYLSDDSPEGQLPYVLSKLAGMVALSLAAWQVITTLLCRFGTVRLTRQGMVHAVLGTLTAVFACLHFALFFLASSSRDGTMAWGLFVPNFVDYYHTHLSLGLIGWAVLLGVLVSGFLRANRKTMVRKVLHRSYWVSIALVYVHAMAIGSESQSTVGMLFYFGLGLAALILAVLWSAKQAKTVYRWGD